jgi:hypothetical protein
MRTARTAAASVALAAALLGCGGQGPTSPTLPPAEPPAAGDPVPVQVLEFDPAGYGRGPVVALSDRPIALNVFAGWYAQADVADDADEPPPAAEPGRTYLAVATTTGCREPTGVTVHRDGADLRVRFTGGTDLPECVRPYGPSVVLSLADADVAGVRTVDGRAPVAPTGPGVLTAFHDLGTGGFGNPAPVELGTGADTTELASALAPSSNPDAAAALERPVPAGSRAFAFLLTGCRDTSAVLLVNYDRVDAELTGGEGIACAAPEYYLATFEIPDDLVPPRATLGRG